MSIPSGPLIHTWVQCTYMPSNKFTDICGNYIAATKFSRISKINSSSYERESHCLRHYSSPEDVCLRRFLFGVKGNLFKPSALAADLTDMLLPGVAECWRKNAKYAVNSKPKNWLGHASGTMVLLVKENRDCPVTTTLYFCILISMYT
jgi:hypothetical protein